MSYIRWLKQFLIKSYSTIKSWNRSLQKKYFIIFITNALKIRMKEKERSVNLNGDKIIIPNNIPWVYILQELFVFDLYKRLHWLDHILDLGWYIWDSWLYLSKYNKKVTVFESDPTVFIFLQKNLSSIDNVDYYNKAVIAKERNIFITKNTLSRWTLLEKDDKNKETIKINTINISNILKENKFDWLKMDIEGWEYEIIEYLLENNIFPFKKGFIELHFTSKEIEKQSKICIDLIEFFCKNKFMFESFDNDWKYISNIDAIHAIKTKALTYSPINIYFETL